jgi:hypothetical protein
MIMVGKVPIVTQTPGGSMWARQDASSEGRLVVLEGVGAIGIVLLADVKETKACKAFVEVKSPRTDSERDTQNRTALVNSAIEFAEAPNEACPRDRKK